MTDAPDSLAGLQRDLKRAIAVMKAKAPQYIEARDYYLGTRAEVSASPTIRRLIQQHAEASPISLAHIPVDAVMDKVELAGLASTDAVADDLLTTIADENDLGDEADDWLRKAGYLGDYYAIVDPSEEEEGSGIATVEGLSIVGSSPFTTVVVYDPKDDRTKLYGAKVWEDAGRWRALLFYDDFTVKLIAIEASKGDRAEDFGLDVPVGAELRDAYIGHVGGRMLIAHLAIDGKPYGTPLHRRAWGPQDAITKVSATNLNNVDAQGFATRWALADPMAETDDDIDDDFGTDGPSTSAADSDGVDSATTGKSRVRSTPGAITILRGIKAVGQFAATSSEDFLKNLDWYVRVMAVATGVPLFEFDLNGEQPSGESRRRAEGRVNRKAAKVKRAAGAFFVELGDIALATLGKSAPVTANFKPGEVAGDTEGIELVAAKIKVGVPVRQALSEAGYPDEQIEEWWPEDGAGVPPAMLTLLAPALQQLGQARTLGVITDEELADMLPDILTAARGEGPAMTDAAPAASVTPITGGGGAIAAAARVIGG